MSTPNTPQRIVLAAAAVAVLVVAFYPPFSPEGIRSGRPAELAAVALATVGFVLALRGLPKLSLAPSGWKRLWIVLSLIYLPVVIGFAWNLYPTNPTGDSHFQAVLDTLQPPGTKALPKEIFEAKLREHHASEQRWFVLKAVLLWAVPVTAVYLLGAALRWVYRGFRPTRGEG